MPHRIPLPAYTRKPGSPAHPFPHQISMRALELLQGATFYPIFVDISVSIHKRNAPDFMEQVHHEFISNGMSESTWESSTDALAKYLAYLPNPIMQVAMVESLSHWDWYIGKLGKFIEFARQHGPKPTIDRKMEKNLPKLSLCSFTDQITILEVASDNTLKIPQDRLDEINEMVLVRNLGVHSQWEVTTHYLNSTKTKGWSLGDVRDVEMSEFEAWRLALYFLINNTANHFATIYSQVPDFDPYA